MSKKCIYMTNIITLTTHFFLIPKFQSNVKSLDYQEKAINHAFHAPFVLNQAGYPFTKEQLHIKR